MSKLSWKNSAYLLLHTRDWVIDFLFYWFEFCCFAYVKLTLFFGQIQTSQTGGQRWTLILPLTKWVLSWYIHLLPNASCRQIQLPSRSPAATTLVILLKMFRLLKDDIYLTFELTFQVSVIFYFSSIYSWRKFGRIAQALTQKCDQMARLLVQ